MSPGSGRPPRRGLWWIALGVALVLVAVLGGREEADIPFDPDSTRPLGLKALVLLVEELGGEVEVTDGPPRADAELVAVVGDGVGLSDEQLDGIDDHLDGGGTVVVTDPSSVLTPLVATVPDPAAAFEGSDPEDVVRGRCDIEALDGVDRLEVEFGVAFYETAEIAEGEGEGPGEAPGEEVCFAGSPGAFVVAQEAGADGAGTLISVGGTTPFVNQSLDRADNAALIAALLVPDGGVEVAWLEEPPLEEGGDADSPFALVSDDVTQAILQLGVAFLLYALWRARRLGAPVGEPQPVEIAGSELVAAVGDLLQRTRSPDRAARLLRADTRRLLAERLGLPTASPPEVVADAAAARLGLDRDHTLAAIVDSPVADDAALVHLARQLDTIRQEVLHGPRT